MLCATLLAGGLCAQEDRSAFPIDPQFDRYLALEDPKSEEARLLWGDLVKRFRDENDPLVERVRRALGREVSNEASTKAFGNVPRELWPTLHVEALERLRRGHDTALLIQVLSDVPEALPTLVPSLKLRLLERSPSDVQATLIGLWRASRLDPRSVEGLGPSLRELLPKVDERSSHLIASLLLQYGEPVDCIAAGRLLLGKDEASLVEVGASIAAAFGIQDERHARTVAGLLVDSREPVRQMARQVVPACGPGAIETALQQLDSLPGREELLRRARGEAELVFGESGRTDLWTLRALCFARRRATPEAYVERLLRDLQFGWESMRGRAACDALAFAEIPKADLFQVLRSVMNGERPRRSSAPRSGRLNGPSDHLARFVRENADRIAGTIAADRCRSIRPSTRLLDWFDTTEIDPVLRDEALLELALGSSLQDELLADRILQGVSADRLGVSPSLLVPLALGRPEEVDWGRLAGVESERVRAAWILRVPYEVRPEVLKVAFDGLGASGRVFEASLLRLSRSLSAIDPETGWERHIEHARSFRSRSGELTDVLQSFCRRYANGSASERTELRGILERADGDVTEAEKASLVARIGRPSLGFDFHFKLESQRVKRYPESLTAVEEGERRRLQRRADFARGREFPEGLAGHLALVLELDARSREMARQGGEQRGRDLVGIRGYLDEIAHRILEEDEVLDRETLRSVLRSPKGRLRGDGAAALAFRLGDRRDDTLGGVARYLAHVPGRRVPDLAGLTPKQAELLLTSTLAANPFDRSVTTRLVRPLASRLDVEGARAILSGPGLDLVALFRGLRGDVVSSLALAKMPEEQLRAFAVARLEDLVPLLADLSETEFRRCCRIALGAALHRMSLPSHMGGTRKPFRPLEPVAGTALLELWAVASHEQRLVILEACAGSGSPAASELQQRIDQERKAAAVWPVGVPLPGRRIPAGGRIEIPKVYWPKGPLRVDRLARALGETRKSDPRWFTLAGLREFGYSPEQEFRLSPELEREIVERAEPLLDLERFRARLRNLREEDHATFIRSVLPELLGEPRIEALRWLAVRRMPLRGSDQQLIRSWIRSDDLDLANWAHRVTRIWIERGDRLAASSPKITDPIQVERLELIRLGERGLDAVSDRLRVLLRIDDPDPRIRLAAANALGAHAKRRSDDDAFTILRSRRREETDVGVQGVLARVLASDPKRDR